ncbi:hypothetical protein C8A00DRAFT_13005 [Chaetomidium leptoderma]|uniref:Uncharacterized protein n=1 Tax=Chaetomidium leptoderma TaxID=669021 RepID=A0AAN6VQM3_9PEZI|nr:hypothetical protein C8A00DRAFT_13005 [Chaetomidium leptoderma]
MDSDEEIAVSFDTQDRHSDGLPAEPVPGLDDILAQLRQDIAAWCDGRPDAAALDIKAAYDELAHLDVKEQSLLSLLYEVGRDEYHSPYSTDPKPASLVLRDFKRDEILCGFAPRRQLLRSRALDLSRAGLRPLNIADLPLEILRIIFNDFEDDAVTESWRRHRVSWDWYMLNDTRERQREIRSPAIAAGVRGIEVSLAYRPKEYADSIDVFKAARLDVLSQQRNYCEYLCDGASWGPLVPADDEEEDEHPDGRAAELRNALIKYGRLARHWDKYVDAIHRGETAGEQPSGCKYQEVLRLGYAEYCRLHQEQRRLLRDATFANALASSVARMPNARSFVFVDKWDPDTEYEDQPLLHDADMLSRFMSAPLKWPEIEDDREQPARELECARLLWEIREDRLRADDKSHIDNFLGAMASRCGQHLRVLRFDFYHFAFASGGDRTNPEGFYHADPFIARLQELPRIRCLHLSCFELQKETLSTLCGNLGSNLECLVMHGLTLHNGRWVEAVDTLREKMAATVARGQCALDCGLWDLHGGEFVNTESRSPTPSDSRLCGDHPLVSEAEKYVKGILEHNPLRSSG